MMSKQVVTSTGIDRKEEDLTLEQREKLVQLNLTLSKTEHNIKKQGQQLQVECRNRIADDSNFISDYELDVIITFWLKESDSDFDEERDNIVAVLNESIKHNNFTTHLGSNNNHNEFQHWEWHPMRNEQHCWLYHCLYDHCDISWVDIFRIGQIWVEFDCRLQDFIEIE